MRIISGTAKGKKIYNPIDQKTRPLKDIVRESIFNILSHSDLLNVKLEKCTILDLFSGVGSFGLEAISRGVKKVVFFEEYSEAINLLTKNLEILSFTKKAEIKKKNIYEEKNFKNLNYKFELIFIDPPFNDKNLETLLVNLKNSKIMYPNTLLVIHRNKKTEDNINSHVKILREEIYGASKIIFGLLIV